MPPPYPKLPSFTPYDTQYLSSSHHSAQVWFNPLVFQTSGFRMPIGGEGGQWQHFAMYLADDKHGLSYSVTEALRRNGWLLHIYNHKLSGPTSLVLQLDHTGYRSSVHEQQRILRLFAEYVHRHVTDKGELPEKLTKEMVYR